MVAKQQLSEDVADPRIMASAKATLSLQHEAERQKDRAEKIQLLSRMKQEGGIFGNVASAELARLSEPYAK